MHIAFTFEYIHDNGLFSRLLKRIEEVSGLPLKLYQEGNTYTIEASGDQPALEALAEQTSSLIPQSLFLKNYAIEPLEKDEENETKNASLEVMECSYAVPYCPECQKDVVTSLDPFKTCKVCGFSDVSLGFEELKKFAKIDATSSEDFFTKLAELLIQEGYVTLPTYNGTRTFSLLGSESKGGEGILVCDPAELSKEFLITQGELDALMMVEKPSVRLKPKLMFRAEHALEEPFYPVFFADDKITLAFVTALKAKGIDAVLCDHVPAFRVASALDEHLIITAGRDMLPWHHAIVLNTPSHCQYGGFESYGDSNGVTVDKKIDVGTKSFIHYVPKDQKSTSKNAIIFEPAHAAQRSIVLEESLEERSLCGVHLSKLYDSHIFSFSKKIGYTSLALFRDQNIVQPRDMLRAIEAMDEGGARLVQNFKNGFPELYEKIEKQTFTKHTDVSDITKIWAMAAVFIGLYEGEDALKSSETLEATAIEFGGKSGPRIDYKVMSTDEGYQLDIRLAIRSAMSFKLAGLDDYLLSFGFIDSLADFIAEQAENADANIGIEGVTLSGGLFENRQLLMRTYNALSVNYPIYRNRRLSVDGANVALGAITLGSE